MLYFLIVVLQRMVHQFWGTATLNSYVQACVAANGKCPPAIIGLLFCLECPNLSPNINVAMPDTKKQRIHDSEAARAAAQAAPSAASAEMHHLVWPAVWAGVIRAAPREHIDNPQWWTDGILQILQHNDVYFLYYKGGQS